MLTVAGGGDTQVGRNRKICIDPNQVAVLAGEAATLASNDSCRAWITGRAPRFLQDANRCKKFPARRR